MTTTAAMLTPSDVRERLEALLKAATDYAVAEERLNHLAVGLGERDGDVLEDALAGLSNFRHAVVGQVQAACHDALHPEEVTDPLHICQEIQDALEVLTFAIERDDQRGDDDAS